MRALTPEFQFAGFTWPRYVADLACGAKAMRNKRELRKVCGGYYHAPKPNSNTGRGFYLADAGQPFTRWVWADDIDESIRHHGWFCDDHQDQTIRGVVVQLPHQRFLAGWSMGVGMASEVGARIFECPIEAARAADEEARITAEIEREYQAAQTEGEDE